MGDIDSPEQIVAVCSPATGVARLVTRWPAAWPFGAAGIVAVVAGGLVAAVSRPLSLELGPWTAAYLVLVGGVAQLTLGVGHAWLARDLPSRRRVWFELVAWDVGVLVTIAGTLLGAPAVTTCGGVALFGATVGFLAVTRSRATPGRGWVLWLWFSVGLAIMSSIPVGVVLAWARHGSG